MTVQIDATTNAHLLNRYLAYSTFTKYHDGKPSWRRSFYTFQWRNVVIDSKELFRQPQIVLPRFAYSMAAFAFILFGDHESAKIMAFGGVVAFDVSSTNGLTSAGQTTMSTTHTAAGSDRWVTVGLAQRPETASSITCTYNAVSMTQAGTISGVSRITRATLFQLIAPSTTAGVSVTASWTGGINWVHMGTISYTGANAVGTAVTDSASTSTASVVVTSATGDMVTDCVSTDGQNPSAKLTVGAGQTERTVYLDAGVDFSGQTSTEAGAASVTMSYSMPSNAAGWSMIGMNIVAGAQPPDVTVTRRRMLMGVGA